MLKSIQLFCLILAVAGFTNLYAQDADAPAAETPAVDAAAQEDAPMGGEVGADEELPAAEEKSLMKEVEDAVANQVKATEEKTADILEDVKNEVETVAEEVKDEVAKVGDEIVDEVKAESDGAFAWIKDKVMMVFDAIKNGIVKLWDGIMGLFGGGSDSAQ